MTLRGFFNKVLTLALRAGFGERSLPQREVAIRIITTAEEWNISARLALNYIPAIFWTTHTSAFEFHILTSRIAAAGCKFAETTLLNN